ncbi:uncharacterized protein LOC116177929 isoform X1 [Photinus pyralis]|uniref:uncharacterized protein LOC116177929 isoform X1 n=1 Tax=Photinus pyralis TaxID=7054 RepID=UPI00126714F0|nr:uncharacterized protein LOC116177929 isoform X1 [Photinus pyralis]
MPKVETSLLWKRGNQPPRLLAEKYNVSSMFGKINSSYRYKRENSLPNRRIVKKLIRVQPVHKNDDEQAVSSDIAQTTGALRKRVLIRKKKLPSTTAFPRRKVVVKKKRLKSSPAPRTSVFTSTEYDFSTVVQTRLRTYTFVVTRVNGDEHIVTSTTEIKPQTKTVTLTDARTILTTLTLYGLEDTDSVPSQQKTVIDSTPGGLVFETEARYNLATRVMSNGVEVIVAGDKTTLPGEPDIKRILPTTIYKPITLKPSTLSDQMMMIIPQESSNIDMASTLQSNQFVTKTCLTTFTYLTTYLENGTTTVSSHEQVVSNVATEDRNSQISTSKSSTGGITLTKQPTLAAGTFQTTYTYFNTVLDGDQPLVLSSKHTVTNTITAPSDYLSLLKPLDKASAFKDTNTYYSTAYLKKTLQEGDRLHVTSTKELVTQVVITESSLPKPTAVSSFDPASKLLTTDVVKTYYVTYTYYNSLIENGEPTVKLNISTSTDVVTEKVFLKPKTTASMTGTIKEKKKNKVDLQIFSTKTYVTTYTSLTTLLQGDKKKVTSTIVSSKTREIENVVTETINANLFDPLFVSSLKSDIKKGTETVVKHATLLNGDKLRITAINKKKIVPTKVLPIEKTEIVTRPITPTIDSSNPHVITGSTIIFFDEEELADSTQATPALSASETATKNNLGLLLSTEIVKKKNTTPTKRHVSTSPLVLQTTPQSKITPEPPSKKTKGKISKPTEIPDLLGLGSINTFQVLKPVINAMAGLIKTNIKNANRSNTFTTTPPPSADAQNRSPIYIPIGDQVADVEIAESQNLATIHINEWEVKNEISPQEAPLMNGGIPISPGQVITANSDVIVGKPGRIGPRIPSIPLNQNNVWAQPPRNEEYLGPPPEPDISLRPQSFIRGEKHRHTLPIRQEPHILFETPVVSKPVHEFKIESPIMKQPLLFPEVIERSTGQPLLVNLQPSQVALINIPFNRTTALLYGGSTELHKNGKYFDDPAPHAAPEFSVHKQLTTHREPSFVIPNQKQVGGYIRVGGETINKNPISVPGPILIMPSKPAKEITSSAPISFEIIQNGGDFNAHIIKHEEMMLQPPPLPYPERPNLVLSNLLEPFKHGVRQKIGIYNSSNSYGQENEGTVYLDNPDPLFFVSRPPFSQQTSSPIRDGSKRQNGYRNRVPSNELNEYLTPPKVSPQIRPPFHRQQIPIHYDAPRPPNSISSSTGDFEGYHKEDDLLNEDGEVVQESISRPLRPGQVPLEVLEKLYNNASVSHFGHYRPYVPKPIIQVPRPFEQHVYIDGNVHVNGQKGSVNADTHRNVNNETMPESSTKVAPSTTSEKVPTTKKLYVTSMPVNVQSTLPNSMKPSLSLQTEKPFTFPKVKPYEVIMQNISRPHFNATTFAPSPDSFDSDIAIMQPPPLITPPLINLKTTNKEKQDPLDLDGQASIQSSVIPPKVVGLRPPPLSYPPTTKKVSEYKSTITTYRPTYSLEINPPRPIHPYTFEIPPPRIGTTTRRPMVSRRPTTKPTEATTASTTRTQEQTTVTSTTKKPITNSTTKSTTLVTETEKRNSVTLPSVSSAKTTSTNSTTIKPTLTIKPLPTIEILPSKILTHTETTTITITRTTVSETLGGLPSTMTILITTTEKLTKLDTVTEIHTLLQPTSVTETITATINHSPTLHPSDVTFSTISSTPTLESVTPSLVAVTRDDLEDFIIRDTDPPPLKPGNNASDDSYKDNDSILVVMTDKKNAQIVNVPELETDLRDEIPTNEINHILLGGILIDSPPILDTKEYENRDKCNPECKATKNELCQKFNGLMRCVCRPGFARMFLDHPCKPTYTYSVKLVLDRNGREKLRYNDSLSDSNSTEFNRLARLTYEGLDRMVMQSDLRDVYHGVKVHGYEPFGRDGVLANEFHLQLSENTEQAELEDVFKTYLAKNNYSLGGTDLHASKEYLEGLVVEDFDECKYTKYHDCSDHAHCFNMVGTYTCSCKEGFSDLSENPIYPGRICSAESVGCERCHYHGTCYSRGAGDVLCECFQWYTGEYCHINLKVLLIALGTLGVLLLVLLIVCCALTCCRKKSRHPPRVVSNLSFIPQRLAVPMVRRGTMDRRLMIQDTSSESSHSDIHVPNFMEKNPKQQKAAMKKSKENNSAPDKINNSLPVVIPRAKYHPIQPPCVSMVPIEKRKSSAASSNETKLLSYLDVGPYPNKIDAKRKHSKTRSEPYLEDRQMPGGALISAGFEVSATVGCGTLGTIATTCGTEADRSENATLIQKISAADILSSTGSQSQFTTFRKSILDNTEDPLSNWLDLAPKITTTVSEARSCDETTIHVPTKSYRNVYDSKSLSQNQNDEANTMAERDVGSTFLLPHTHLYKRDRGSDDASGFDSL